MLEGGDPGGAGAFALILCPNPVAFRQLMGPHPREFAHFFQKNASARGLARVGGAWALLELTDALGPRTFLTLKKYAKTNVLHQSFSIE